ncbi:uncharacterized protein LOC113498782 [Trichoplusia ni]|uniref:Uncharacterized protein LOC113498782 n=1 Tax=Trichoplusia ni TaxID=7111 RepID=A0A7E5W2J1_TRINI|nr:uncharacterized protein LOC113498782 [Trichoplusia ni]
MLTRLQARAARLPSPDSSPSSASQLPPDRGSATAVAVASSSSDEYYSPPTSPTPVHRQGRRRPPSSLAPSGQPASNRAPAPGGVVQRMKWTRPMNENVMRAYYGATGGGTNLTAYRARMLSLFQALEPDVDVSAQRLSDQVRVIQRNRRLDDATLDRLRSEVRISPIVSAPSLTVVPVHGTPPTNFDGEHDDGAITVSTQCNDLIRSTLEDVIREYRTSPPGLRPRVPRLPMHNKNKAIMGVLDSLLPTYFESSVDLTDTHSILYCAALTACRVANVAIRPNNNATRPKPAVPAWQCRIEQRIAGARTLIAKLKTFKEGNSRPRVMRFVKRAFAGTNISPSEYFSRVTERIDFYKQKVYAWANRIRRYKCRVERYHLNRMFQKDERWVYRTWERPGLGVDDGSLPDDDATKSFWRSIWSEPVSHAECDWMREVEQSCEHIQEMGAITISPQDVATATRSLSNWKAPGPDGLQNYWLKWLRSSHDYLASQFQSVIESGKLPLFFTTGSSL